MMLYSRFRQLNSIHSRVLMNFSGIYWNYFKRAIILSWIGIALNEGTPVPLPPPPKMNRSFYEQRNVNL